MELLCRELIEGGLAAVIGPALLVSERDGMFGTPFRYIDCWKFIMMMMIAPHCRSQPYGRSSISPFLRKKQTMSCSHVRHKGRVPDDPCVG